MFEDFKKNIEQEKKIIADMYSIQVNMQNDATNQQFYLSNLNTLSQQLILLNKTVPEFLKEWSPIKKLVKKQGELQQSKGREISYQMYLNLL